MSGKLPERPPLQIFQDGYLWVVAEYQGGDQTGETRSTHETRFEALRAAKAKIDNERYPCLIEWESTDNVRELYWNPLFETLLVEYDELLNSWVVTPAESTVALATNRAFEPTKDQAKTIQRRYHFKSLCLHSKAGTLLDTRDHRFLRYRIADPDVRFDSAVVESPPDVDPLDSETQPDDDSEPTQARPTRPGRLAVSIPDVTDVEVITTEGVLHRFRTRWEDDQPAEIIALAPAYVDDEQAIEAFKTQLERWMGANTHDNVATIYDWGIDPTPSVAFAAGTSLAEIPPFELDLRSRLTLVKQVASGAKALCSSDETAPGVNPEFLSIPEGTEASFESDLNTDADTDAEGLPTVSVEGCGIDWRVHEALDKEYVTPFVSPEQLKGKVTATTAVYQVAALAYWLLCEQPPVEATPLDRAILTGQIQRPETLNDENHQLASVLMQGLASSPQERYQSLSELCNSLYDACKYSASSK